jgi:hypothetical protein
MSEVYLYMCRCRQRLKTGIPLSKRLIECPLIRFRKQETDVIDLSCHRKDKKKTPLSDRCLRVQLIISLFIFLAYLYEVQKQYGWEEENMREGIRKRRVDGYDMKTK